jgi:DMSO reductase anchor subunit
MKPAASVILFTVLSGAGYGILAVIALAALIGDLPDETAVAVWTLLAALGLVTAGLLSSTFHLGHPERTWRALSQWRSSWLSREGCASLATYLPAGLFGIGWVLLDRTDGVYAFLAVLTGSAAMTTVYCTGMIYGSLVTIPQWRQPLVVPLYLAFALATGSLICAALFAMLGVWITWLAWLSALSLLGTWALKRAYWHAIDNEQTGSTTATAIGLGAAGPVRPLDPPHSEENFIMKEMGFQVARKHGRKLRRLALHLGGTLPILLVVGAIASPAALASTILLALALPPALLGVFVERWLFFAEATHKVMLYYGRQTA